MKRIFKSSNFWNAVFFTISVIISIISITLVFKFIISDGTITEIISVINNFMLYQFILFGGRTAVSGFADILKIHKGVVYNPQSDKDEKLT